MSEPKIHMVCGSTGAGKTTYSMKLENALPAVRFSIDEWMMELFWPDASPETTFDWAYERVERCGRMMRSVAIPVLRNGSSVIFDTAFSTRNERHDFYAWARAENLDVHLHFLDVSQETRWSRVEKRNSEREATFAFQVTRGMFDGVEKRWQPPCKDELSEVPHTLINA